MYQLLLKQRFKFAVRMVKRNIGAYLILIAIVPCILILQSMIQKNYGMDIAVFIPYGILCFLFMNLFGTIPRMRISPETYIWKIEKTYIWRVKKIGKSMVLTLSVALILFWAFPMEGMVLRQFIVAMLCNPIVNMHTVLSTQYKYRDIMNICMLAVVMICFFYGSVFVTSILLIIYGLYFILYPYFSYQAIIPFFQQYNQMLYGFLNREYDTVLQTQDEVFFQNNQKESKRQTMRLTLNETPLFYERRGFLHSSGSSDDQGIRSSNSAGSIFPCLSQRFGSSVRIYLK